MVASRIDNRRFLLSATPVRLLDAATRVPIGKQQPWTKDILRVGVLHNADWPQPWNVTPEVLDTIARSFRLAQSNGNAIPVQMAKDDADQHSNNSAYKVGEVLSVYVEGDTLYADFWTNSETDPEVYQLDTKKREVSVSVQERFMDGNGVEYPLFLEHIAIVNGPVVTGQGPFLRRLSLKSSNAKGTKPMAKSRQLAADDAASEGADDQSWTLDEVKELLAKFSIVIPDSATTKEAIMAVADALSGGGSEESAETPVAEMPAEMAAKVAENPTSYPPAQLSAACRTLARQCSTQSKQLASQAAADLSARKNNYDATLKRHVSRGAITEADRTEQLTAGAVHGYQLSAISVLDKVPDSTSVPLNGGNGKSKQLATGAAPKVDANEQSADEVAAKARKFWDLPAKK